MLTEYQRYDLVNKLNEQIAMREEEIAVFQEELKELVLIRDTMQGLIIRNDNWGERW